MKTKLLITTLLVAFACAAGAQQGKVGIIDLRKVFDDYHKTKTAAPMRLHGGARMI